jgi:hypothetical protein
VPGAGWRRVVEQLVCRRGRSNRRNPRAAQILESEIATDEAGADACRRPRRHVRTPWLRAMRRGRKFRTNPKAAGILAIPRWQRNPRRRAFVRSSTTGPRQGGRGRQQASARLGSEPAKARPEPIPLGRRGHGFPRSHGPAQRDVKGQRLMLRCRHADPSDARRPAVARGAGLHARPSPPARAQPRA